MKQSGTIWTDPQGLSVPAKYIAEFDKLAEKNVNIIAEMAEKLSQQMAKAKSDMMKLGLEMHAILPKAQRSLTAYTFDHEYKVVFDTQTNLIYVYKATKKDPQKDDYERIPLEFASLLRSPELPLQETKPETPPVEKGAGDDYPVVSQPLHPDEGAGDEYRQDEPTPTLENDEPQGEYVPEVKEEQSAIVFSVPDDELHPSNRTETIRCMNCQGTGEVEDNGPKHCPQCGGNGTLDLEKATGEAVEEAKQSLREKGEDPDELDIQVQLALDATDGPKDDAEEQD
jgi:hypothetical protein